MKHTKRLKIVFDLNARGGMYSPEVHIHRSGKNGSPNGFGPKLWPAWLIKMADNGPHDFGGMLVIRVPHLTYGRAYRLRRFGAGRLYRLNFCLNRKVCG